MLQPPVTGMPPEIWSWLREALPVRPRVVAAVRARLDAGERPPAEDVARAMLEGPWHDGTRAARGEGTAPRSRS